MDSGAAEASLAPSHSSIAAPLYPIDGAGDNGPVNGLHNLPLSDGLTPAYNPSVQGIGPDDLLLFPITEPSKDNPAAAVCKLLLFLKHQAAAFKNLLKLLGNGRRTGKSRRLDSSKVNESRALGSLSDDKIRNLGVGAHSCIFMDDLAKINTWN